MLGEGWTLEADTAKSIGLVSQVVQNQELLVVADEGSRELLTSKGYRSIGTLVSYQEVCSEYGLTNLFESVAVSDSCFS